MAVEIDEGAIWRLATALSGAATPTDVGAALAEHGAPAAGASFSNVAVLDVRTNRVHVVHSSVLDPVVAARWQEFDITEPTPLCEAILGEAPVLLGSADAIGRRYPNLLADTAASSLQATASLPLRTAAGLVLGAAGFGWDQPQSFESDQVQRLDLISQMAAQALDRALLYERERVRGSERERAEARLLQDAFLPATLPDTDSLAMAAAYLPASDAAMGGDWFDAFTVETCTFFVIGDVAGHGLRSAAVMAQLRNGARAFADEDPSPATVLTRLNRMLCHLEPEETATAIVAVWDPEARTLLRSNAGHPPALRCRRGEFSFLVPPAGGVMLGVDPDLVYQEEAKLLRPGTTLLFYTDGLIEARGVAVDEGMNELKTFVEGLGDLSPQVLCDEVLQWRLAAGRREDDMCLLAVRLA
ncbi:MAG: hypothetical protein QOG64_1022 [Acidimicrobiaceae bacterium]|nr:hypothetical protein [Acidimicrobiaceae bacterium]